MVSSEAVEEAEEAIEEEVENLKIDQEQEVMMIEGIKRKEKKMKKVISTIEMGEIDTMIEEEEEINSMKIKIHITISISMERDQDQRE